MNKIYSWCGCFLLIPCLASAALDQNYCQQGTNLGNIEPYVSQLCQSAASMQSALKNDDKSEKPNAPTPSQLAFGNPAPETPAQTAPIVVAPPTPSSPTPTSSNQPNNPSAAPANNAPASIYSHA